MSESGEEDIEHLRAVGKKALWLSNKMEQERAKAKDRSRGGELFRVGATYTIVIEHNSQYDDVPTEVEALHYMKVSAVEGALVLFSNGTVLNTQSRTFARAFQR